VEEVSGRRLPETWMNSSFAIAPRLPRGKAAFARERICNNLSIFRREGTQEKHLL
jgi:hypothetical protein